MMPEATKAKRSYLDELSRAVQPLVKDGKYALINDALINEIYRCGDHKEFKTFQEWKKEGYSVKKGEKAFLVWGRPVDKQRSEEQVAKGQQPDEPDERKFFPLSFLFSNAQVERTTQRKDAQ